MFKWGKNRQEWQKFYFNLQINLRYIDVSHLHLRFPTVSEKISRVTVNVKDKLNRMISIQVRAKDWPQMHTMFIFNWHYGNFHYSRFLQLWHSLSLVHLHLNLHSHSRTLQFGRLLIWVYHNVLTFINLFKQWTTHDDVMDVAWNNSDKNKENKN